MKSLLTTLFKKSILLGDIEYTDLEKETGWIGNSPATIEEIEKAEAKLNVKFPEDYKEMLLIANGFKRCNDAVECDFIKSKM